MPIVHPQPAHRRLAAAAAHLRPSRMHIPFSFGPRLRRGSDVVDYENENDGMEDFEQALSSFTDDDDNLSPLPLSANGGLGQNPQTRRYYNDIAMSPGANVAISATSESSSRWASSTVPSFASLEEAAHHALLRASADIVDEIIRDVCGGADTLDESTISNNRVHLNSGRYNHFRQNYVLNMHDIDESSSSMDIDTIINGTAPGNAPTLVRLIHPNRQDRMIQTRSVHSIAIQHDGGDICNDDSDEASSDMNYNNNNNNSGVNVQLRTGRNVSGFSDFHSDVITLPNVPVNIVDSSIAIRPRHHHDANLAKEAERRLSMTITKEISMRSSRPQGSSYGNLN